MVFFKKLAFFLTIFIGIPLIIFLLLEISLRIGYGKQLEKVKTPLSVLDEQLWGLPRCSCQG